MSWVRTLRVTNEIARASTVDPVPTVAIPATPDLLLTLDVGNLRAGLYTGVVSYFVGTNQPNTSLWFDVYINGAPSPLGPGAAVENLVRANVQMDRTALVEFEWPGGPLVLTQRVARDAGPGIITFFRSIQRVNETVTITV